VSNGGGAPKLAGMESPSFAHRKFEQHRKLKTLMSLLTSEVVLKSKSLFLFCFYSDCRYRLFEKERGKTQRLPTRFKEP